MQPQLQFVEDQCDLHRDGQLAIENKAFRADSLKRVHDVREIARQRLAGFRLQENFVTVAKRDAAEPVPLRLVLPLIADRNFLDGPRLHRRQRRFKSERHFVYLRGSSFGGRFPFRMAPATETYFSSQRSTAQRRSNPPRLMSPRPTKSAGKQRRCPKCSRRTSTYFAVAMLPSKTIWASAGNFFASCRTSRSSGAR